MISWNEGDDEHLFIFPFYLYLYLPGSQESADGIIHSATATVRYVKVRRPRTIDVVRVITYIV